MRLVSPRSATVAVAVLVVTSLIAAVPAAAQETRTSGSDRLFLGFAQEATVIDGQWWEGQGEFADADEVESTIGRLVFALQPLYQLEVGGRVGFGSTDTPGGVLDGSGATDFDGWVKYYLGAPADNTEFAVGGTLTVPTGDDTAGLGQDSWAVGLFGSARHSLKKMIVSGYLGARYNQDGRYFGVDLDGELSIQAGAGVLAPIADEVTLVAELVFETERFSPPRFVEYDGSDLRALGGINWRISNRSMIRGAFTVGSADGAPDFQIFGGYAATF